MYLKLSFAFALVLLTSVSKAEDYQPYVQPTPPPSNSVFYVGLLDPLHTLVSANVYHAVKPNIRVGASVGTTTLGYTYGISVGAGVHFLLKPTQPVTPVLGITFLNAEVSNGNRRSVTYITTGIDIRQENDVMMGFGVNWSMTQYDGKNIVMSYFRIGSFY